MLQLWLKLCYVECGPPASPCRIVEEDGEDLRKAQQAIYLLYLLSEKKAGALVTPAAHFRQFPIEKNLPPDMSLFQFSNI